MPGPDPTPPQPPAPADDRPHCAKPGLLALALRRTMLYCPFFFLTGFLVFHVVAAAYYPGGNIWDHQEKGFNWLANFYCDLFNEGSYSGDLVNHGRPFALVSLACLILSFLSLWTNLSSFWVSRKAWMISSNVFAWILVASFSLLTTFHDLALVVTMLLGLGGFAFLFVVFLRRGERACLWTSIVLLLSVSAAFSIWATQWRLDALPMVQRVAFAVFLWWACLVSVKVIRSTRYAPAQE